MFLLTFRIEIGELMTKKNTKASIFRTKFHENLREVPKNLASLPQEEAVLES